MPQVDLETLVCGGGDGKVSCETLVTTIPGLDPDLDPDPNLPPESFRIPIEDYSLDLAAAAAAVIYERDDSAKESTNPKSQTHNPNPSQSRSNSQRYPGATNLKANNGPILGLPNKIKIKHVTCSRTDTNSRIFPKKKPAKAGAKSAVPEHEPSSPKVSCFGKVLSDRERKSCQVAHRRRQRDSSGCWVGLVELFSCSGGGKEKRAIEVVEEKDGDVVASRDIFLKRRNIPFDGEEEQRDGNRPVPVPGLGGMKRFASGRRASSWGSDVDVDVDVDVDTDGHVAVVDLSRQRSLDKAWGVGPTAA